MADVFISYAREDRERAERLARALEAAGWSVWWDREILPGHDFTAVIGAELAAARAVVVIWSAASIGSRWVRDEAAEGLERGALVPVLFDGVEPPMGFRSIHAADLAGWEAGDEAAFEQIRAAIAGLPAVGAVPPEPVPPRRPITSRRRLPWRRLGLAGLALAAVAALVAFLPSLVAFKDDSDRPPVPEPDTGGTAEPFRDCASCPEMVPLRPGRFRMGASWLDRQSQSDERPRVTVDVTQPLAIGRHEVTFAQWEACVEGGGCGGRKPDDAGWGRGQRPVVDVAWADAQAYAAWLRAKTGKPYRLPTEAEWEYACRAGTGTAYPFGDNIGPFLANHDRQVGTTREVGAYPPNPWGLHDLNGNVWEWVEDV
jgi:formylglycine-generating enzyme required for sulfatase activity